MNEKFRKLKLPSLKIGSNKNLLDKENIFTKSSLIRQSYNDEGNKFRVAGTKINKCKNSSLPMLQPNTSSPMKNPMMRMSPEFENNKQIVTRPKVRKLRIYSKKNQ